MESNCYGLTDNSLGSDSQFFFNPTANSSNSPIVIVQNSVAIKNVHTLCYYHMLLVFWLDIHIFCRASIEDVKTFL